MAPTPPIRDLVLNPESQVPELSPSAAAVLLRILRKEHDRTTSASAKEAA